MVSAILMGKWCPFWLQNESILVPFWLHFGPLLGPKCGPFWDHFGPKKKSFWAGKQNHFDFGAGKQICFWSPKNKIGRKRNFKIDLKSRFLDHFGPEKKIPGRKRKFFLGLNFLRNRPKRGRNRPKKAQNRPKIDVFGPFSANFSQFWAIFFEIDRNRPKLFETGRNLPDLELARARASLSQALARAKARRKPRFARFSPRGGA